MDKAHTILIKGAGEKASAVAHGLFSNGFKRIIMTDIPDLGKIIEKGYAEEHTGIPTEVIGKSLERLLISPETGTLYGIRDIGDSVEEGDIIGYVGDRKLISPISGFVWGLIRTPANVKEGQKLGDIYPGSDRQTCFEITPQAKKIAGAVIDVISKNS